MIETKKKTISPYFCIKTWWLFVNIYEINVRSLSYQLLIINRVLTTKSVNQKTLQSSILKLRHKSLYSLKCLLVGGSIENFLNKKIRVLGIFLIFWLLRISWEGSTLGQKIMMSLMYRYPLKKVQTCWAWSATLKFQV